MQLWEIQYEVKLEGEWIQGSMNVVAKSLDDAVKKCRCKEEKLKYPREEGGGKTARITGWRLLAIRSVADIDIR